jgi:hypothetical protein
VYAQTPAPAVEQSGPPGPRADTPLVLPESGAIAARPFFRSGHHRARLALFLRRQADPAGNDDQNGADLISPEYH